jgi:hypothetical protein
MRMPGQIRFCALVLCSLAFPIAIRGQAPSTSTGQVPPQVAQMLNAQVVWDNGFNHPNGSRLRFAKVDEVTRPQGHYTRYRIYAAGVPEGPAYILAAWTIGKSVDELNVLSDAVYVNRKGLLLTRKPNAAEEDSDTVAPDAEYDLGVQAADGEPLRFLLRSADNKVLVPGTLVPYPIQSADKACRLSALLAEPDGEAILIEGNGFPPNSEAVVRDNSAGEQRQSKKSVDAAGHFQFVELPYVFGKTAGILTETITAKGCAVSVTIPWGNGSYHRR